MILSPRLGSFLRRSRTHLTFGLLILLSLSSGACSTVTRIHGPDPLDTKGRWAILPIANLAETAQAGERVEVMLDTVLRQQGVVTLDHYPSTKQDELTPLADDHTRYETSLAWARTKHYDFAVTGTIEEWRYKTGAEADPSVGLTVVVVDLKQDKVLWTGTGASVGSSNDNTSGVALRLLSTLVEHMRFR
jgi:hypothetical protein